jgi:hypothetical protein
MSAQEPNCLNEKSSASEKQRSDDDDDAVTFL